VDNLPRFHMNSAGQGTADRDRGVAPTVVKHLKDVDE
jgi:hypothetical protein